MVPYCPERILVEEEAWSDCATREMPQRLPGIATRTIPNVESMLPQLRTAADFRTVAKRTLILNHNRGSFMKACPRSGTEICCNYFVSA
ncbi:MAG: hypothetical protein ABSH28_05355 [Acidobacteriota bacterium]|jgi:hypothetical protein